MLYCESSLVRSGIARTVCTTQRGAGTAFAWHTRRLKIRKDQASPEFLVHLLDDSTTRRVVESVATQTALTGVTTKDYFGVKLKLPPLLEQQKIAAILSSVDEVIESTRAQIDKLKDLKTGIVQESFARGIGQLEFDDSPVARTRRSWQLSALGELVTKVGSGITPRGGSSSYVDFGIPLIRSQNVHPDGLRLDNVSYITYEQHQKMANSQLKPHDVLLNITGASIGRCYYLPPDFREGNVNQHVCIIRGKKNQINPVFLTLFLNSEFGQKQIMSLQAGGNREGLNFQQVRAIKLPLPPLCEQERIAASVSGIDRHIRKRRAKLSQVTNLKKALMQDLLTGKVRVNVDRKESAVA